MGIITGLFLAAVIAFIPANIAKNKGYSFGGWWLYGFLLWIVALPHAMCLEDKNRKQMQEENKHKEENKRKEEMQPGVLLKYKELLDKSIITQEEFEKKKKEILMD